MLSCFALSLHSTLEARRSKTICVVSVLSLQFNTGSLTSSNAGDEGHATGTGTFTSTGLSITGQKVLQLVASSVKQQTPNVLSPIAVYLTYSLLCTRPKGVDFGYGCIERF